MNKPSAYTHGATYFKWSLILCQWMFSLTLQLTLWRLWRGAGRGSCPCKAVIQEQWAAAVLCHLSSEHPGLCWEMQLCLTLIRLSWVSIFISLKHFTLQRHLEPDWIFGEGPSLKALLITRTGSPQHQDCHFKKHLLYDLMLGDPVRSRELDLRILLGLFQLKIFYNSIRALLRSPQIADCCFMEDFWTRLAIRSPSATVHVYLSFSGRIKFTLK